MDVKFLTLKREKGGPARRYQYTAIDDSTRIRALKVYRRHTQANAIDFINYVVEKFPFRICTIRTDRGHEFQALFHWHVADQGMEHVYIKPKTPQLKPAAGPRSGRLPPKTNWLMLDILAVVLGNTAQTLHPAKHRRL